MKYTGWPDCYDVFMKISCNIALTLLKGQTDIKRQAGSLS